MILEVPVRDPKVEDGHLSSELNRRDWDKEGGAGGGRRPHWSELNHTKEDDEKKKPRAEL